MKRLNCSYLFIKRQAQAIETTLKYENKNIDSQEYFEKTSKELKHKLIKFTKILDMYKAFVNELQDFLERTIYLGAVNAQNLYSLKIVSLMQEFLDPHFLEGLKPELLSAIFTFMLLDTYDKNKELCFDIHKKADARTWGHITSMEKELLELAIKLPNNITPIDSCTASYLFKLLLLCPDILQTLNDLKFHKKYENALIATDHASLYTIFKLIEEHIEVTTYLFALFLHDD